MHLLKRLFTKSTGYWIHRQSTLPVGTDLFLDIHKRINYGTLSTVFDVGANLGQTWAWIRQNEPNSKIYCFEPVKQSFDILCSRTGNDKKCIAENIAFGSSQSEKWIKLFESNMSVLNSLNDNLMNDKPDATTELIRIETIANYCEKNRIINIDFLKIDTEGYEIAVLEGAENLLAAARISFIYCEVGFLKRNSRNTGFSELTEWLARRSYMFYGLYQLGCNELSEGNHFGNALYVHKNIFRSQSGA